MNQTTDPISPQADDPLDRLLARADWPDLPRGAEWRLAQTLADEHRRMRPARWPWISAAAGIAAAVAIGVCIDRPTPPQLPAIANNTIQPTPVVPHPVTAPAEPIRERPANQYERMLADAVKRTVPKKINTPKTPALPTELVTSPAQLAANRAAVATVADWPNLRRSLSTQQTRTAVAAALVQRQDRAGIDLVLRGVMDAQTRPALLSALHAAANPPVDQLFDRLADPLVDHRLAAARALGAACDPAVLERLADMAQTNTNRREALAALLVCDSPTAQKLLAKLDDDPAVARQAGAMRATMKSLYF